MAATFALLLAAAVSGFHEPGIMAAVDTCLAAVGPAHTDDARIIGDGWTEQKPVEPDEDPLAERLFRKDGAGAALVVMIEKTDGREVHHCHVITRRDKKGAIRIEKELARHLGAKVTRNGGKLEYTVLKQDTVITSERTPVIDGIMIDIHTIAFDSKEEK